jgi:enterochelin esterase-like enzyme
VEDYFYFVRDELSPFIESRYPVAQDNRALIGHSFLGLFVNYAFFLDDEQSPYFQSFISLDGTVIGSGEQLQENLQSRVERSSSISQKLILVTATGTSGNVISVTWLYNQIIAAGFDSVDVSFLSYDIPHREVFIPALPDVLTLTYGLD